MENSFDLTILGGTVWTVNGPLETDLGIRQGRVAAFGDLKNAKTAQSLAAAGLTILPGAIDTQVHFREPGLTHKEDLEAGTAGAALGGVTAIFEMPNTNPNTLDAADIQDKLDRAKGRAWVDHAFFVGASEENIDTLAKTELVPGCSGVKIFMGSSTGSLLVAEDESLERVLSHGRRRVAIHAEDEARLRERGKVRGICECRSRQSKRSSRNSSTQSACWSAPNTSTTTAIAASAATKARSTSIPAPRCAPP